TNVHPKIAAFRPTESLHSPHKGIVPDLRCGIALRVGHQHGDQRQPAGLLRARRKRPSRRATEQRDELAAFHSITSSAMASRVAGTVRRSIRAVGALMTSSNLLDCTTGRS